jgi:hypothetical protein
VPVDPLRNPPMNCPLPASVKSVPLKPTKSFRSDELLPSRPRRKSQLGIIRLQSEFEERQGLASMPKPWQWIALLWAVSIAAGALWGYEEVCHFGPGLCSAQHVALSAARKSSEFLNYLSPALTALATAVIGVFTYFLYRATNGLLQHTRTIERAYVKLSHTSPGAAFDENQNRVALRMEVKNCGRTPAYVTDVILTPVVLPANRSLPSSPSYGYMAGYPSARAFLVAAPDHVFVDMNFELPEMPGVMDGTMTLYFVDYVDYIDAFKARHRAGYARFYDRQRAANNLVFVADSAYNYDIPRERGIGRDWGENYD